MRLDADRNTYMMEKSEMIKIAENAEAHLVPFRVEEYAHVRVGTSASNIFQAKITRSSSEK